MQVYQGMDVGTAKPTLAEQTEIPHHLLNVVPPNESFSVAQFVERADAVITNAERRAVNLIATGGTPLYFKSLFEGLFDGPGADAELRGELQTLQNEQLHERLTQVDPASAARIHVRDRKRLIRALEVYQLSGRPISALQEQWRDNAPPRHPAIWLGIRWETSAPNQRINQRVKEMIQAGWVEEVRRLSQQYGQLSKAAGEAAGYAELIQHLEGRATLDEAIEQIKISTRQLARRQRKWFRRFQQVHWLDGERGLEFNTEQALELWESGKDAA